MKIDDCKKYVELILLLTQKGVNHLKEAVVKGKEKGCFCCFPLLSRGGVLNNSLSGLMKQRKESPRRGRSLWRTVSYESFTQPLVRHSLHF